MTKRQILGLLAIDGANGSTVDDANSTTGFSSLIPGLPPHVQENLILGEQLRLAMMTPQHEKRGRGRPRKADIEQVDRKRAWICWWIVQRMREQGKPVTRSSTSAAALIEQARDLPRGTELFSKTTDQSTLQQSIYRGKTALQIDEDWNSAACEEIARF